MGKPDNGHGNQRLQLSSIGNGKSGRRSSHRIGSNRNGRPGARGEPGNQGGGQATASGATATGGTVQGVSPTTGMGTNVVGVQGPRANAPSGMPPGLAGTGVMPGVRLSHRQE